MMSEEIKRIKLYGAIGQLLIVISVFIFPLFGILLKFLFDIFDYYFLFFLLKLFKPNFYFLLFIGGNILVIFSVKKISDIGSKKEMFRKFLIYYILSFVSIIGTIFFSFFLLIFGFGSAMSDQPMPGINSVLLIFLFSIFIIFFLFLYFYRKALLIVFQLTNKGLFRLSGNFVLLGGITSAVSLIVLLFKPDNIKVLTYKLLILFIGAGIFLIFWGFLLTVFAFFGLKEIQFLKNQEKKKH